MRPATVSPHVHSPDVLEARSAQDRRCLDGCAGRRPARDVRRTDPCAGSTAHRLGHESRRNCRQGRACPARRASGPPPAGPAAPRPRHDTAERSTRRTRRQRTIAAPEADVYAPGVTSSPRPDGRRRLSEPRRPPVRPRHPRRVPRKLNHVFPCTPVARCRRIRRRRRLPPARPHQLRQARARPQGRHPDRPETKDSDRVKADAESTDRALSVLRGRVDALGVAEPTLARSGETPHHHRAARRPGSPRSGRGHRPDRAAVVPRGAARCPPTADEKPAEGEQLLARRGPAAPIIVGPALLDGNGVRDAAASTDQQGLGQWIVNVDFNGTGQRRVEAARVGDACANPAAGNRVAIVLDDKVISSPGVVPDAVQLGRRRRAPASPATSPRPRPRTSPC